MKKTSLALVVESFTEHNNAWLSISFCTTNLTSRQWLLFASFLRFFSWNSLILGQCILGSGWGWGGWWQKLKQWRKKTQIAEFRVAMMCTYTHKGPIYSTTRPRQTCIDSGSRIRSPQPNWSPPIAPFHQLWIYMVGKKYSGKADQSSLASGGSKHA